jgi:hypothetical protein
MTTTDETRLAQLQRQHAARWDIWKVHSRDRTAWCVKPAGTKTGVHHEDSPDHLNTWIRRIDALTNAGITITFHSGYKNTATATWTSPGSTAPESYGPASTGDVLDHAEDIRARRAGLIQWLATSPEETARHLTDAQIQDLIPHVPDDNARRVLEAIIRRNAATRREDYLARHQPDTLPLTLTGDAATEQAGSVPGAR